MNQKVREFTDDGHHFWQDNHDDDDDDNNYSIIENIITISNYNSNHLYAPQQGKMFLRTLLIKRFF